MKNKKYIVYFLFIVITTGLLINLQSFIIKVEAEGVPIYVTTDELGFGIVFPGEKLEKEFTVFLDIQEANEVEYKITQTPKSGYFNLCPFLEKVNEEGEGDTETLATLNATSDIFDTWKIVLKVPAILGFVAQDHIYGIISQGGDYGCGIEVEIIE